VTAVDVQVEIAALVAAAIVGLTDHIEFE